MRGIVGVQQIMHDEPANATNPFANLDDQTAAHREGPDDGFDCQLLQVSGKLHFLATKAMPGSHKMLTLQLILVLQFHCDLSVQVAQAIEAIWLLTN